MNVRLARARVALALGQLALADAALERLGDPVAARGDQRLGRLEDHDVDTGARGHLGDAGAHLTGADDAHPLNAHCFSLVSDSVRPRPGCWAGPALSIQASAHSVAFTAAAVPTRALAVKSQWNWPSSVEPASAVVDEVGSTVVAIRSK